MKKYIILAMLVCSTTLSLAQTNNNKSTSVKVDVEVVLNKQVEILNARIDSITIVHQQIIDKVLSETKDNCINYYDRLDNEMDRTLTKFSWIWGLLGAFIGILIPIIINRIYERSLKEEIEKLKNDISNQVFQLNRETSIGMRNLERVTMSRVRERYNDIDQQLKKLNEEASSLGLMKEQLEVIKTKIEVSERNAKESQKQAMISRLFSEALSVADEDSSRAIELYSRIISLNDKELRAYNNRAVAYFQNEEFEKAIEDTTSILNIDSNYVTAYAIRALANARLNNRAEAINDFESCIRYGNDEEKIKAYESRATELIRFEMWQDAIRDYDTIAETRPLNTFELNNRAYAYYSLGKNDIAYIDATKSIEADNKNAAAYDTLGCICIAKEMYYEALDYFNKAIEIIPDLWESYENRANLYKILIDIATTESEKAKYRELYEKDIETVRTKWAKKDDDKSNGDE